MSAPLNAASMNVSLTVADLGASIKFYCDGLGFEILERHEDRFAQLKAGAAMIGLGADDFAKGRDRVKGIGLRIWINTDQDIVAIAARAEASGIKLDAPAQALPWGPMGVAITDPDGFKITIANPR